MEWLAELQTATAKYSLWTPKIEQGLEEMTAQHKTLRPTSAKQAAHLFYNVLMLE